jgi:hypothetical protein
LRHETCTKGQEKNNRGMEILHRDGAKVNHLLRG